MEGCVVGRDVVKVLMRYANVSTKDCSAALGIKEQSFRNKLYRDNFSFNEFLIISNICGYSTCMFPEKDEYGNTTFEIRGGAKL